MISQTVCTAVWLLSLLLAKLFYNMFQNVKTHIIKRQYIFSGFLKHFFRYTFKDELFSSQFLQYNQDLCPG
jgi:hypothetical protein